MRLVLFVCLIAFIPVACFMESEPPTPQPLPTPYLIPGEPRLGAAFLDGMIATWLERDYSGDFSIEILCARDPVRLEVYLSAPTTLGPESIPMKTSESWFHQSPYQKSVNRGGSGNEYYCGVELVEFEPR